MKLSERVRKAREFAGLTQVELAERIKTLFGASITQAAISKLEKGGASTSFIAELAAACGVSAIWLSSEQGPMVLGGPEIERPSNHNKGKTIYVPVSSSKRLARIVELWYHLTDEAQEHMLDRIEAAALSTKGMDREPPVAFKTSRRSRDKAHGRR